MVQYTKSSGGYYYKILSNGDKKRISKEEYIEKNKILNGGDIASYFKKLINIPEKQKTTIEDMQELKNYFDSIKMKDMVNTISENIKNLEKYKTICKTECENSLCNRDSKSEVCKQIKDFTVKKSTYEWTNFCKQNKNKSCIDFIKYYLKIETFIGNLKKINIDSINSQNKLNEINEKKIYETYKTNNTITEKISNTKEKFNNIKISDYLNLLELKLKNVITLKSFCRTECEKIMLSKNKKKYDEIKSTNNIIELADLCPTVNNACIVFLQEYAEIETYLLLFNDLFKNIMYLEKLFKNIIK